MNPMSVDLALNLLSKFAELAFYIAAILACVKYLRKK